MTTFGGSAQGGGVLSNLPPSWIPAQGELMVEVDSKFIGV